MSQIDELEARLDSLTAAVLMPLRASKHVDRQAVEYLCQLVVDLIKQVGDAPVISRQLTGKAWRYESQLEKLFGPWYGQGPPTPGLPRY